MNIKVIGCQPLRRELYALAALSPHELDVELIPPDSPLEFIQQRINFETRADYVVLAMGCCAAQNLCSADRPLVVAKVHNCAHLLLGSAGRYRKAFSENEDAPSWLTTPPCQKCAVSHGVPCAVGSVLGGAQLAGYDAAREYVADASLLKKLLHGSWDSDILTVFAHGKIVADPVEILAAEPI